MQIRMAFTSKILLLAVGYFFSATSGLQAPKLTDLSSSFKSISYKKEFVNFTIKASGDPDPTCHGWYHKIGDSRWKKVEEKSRQFTCIRSSGSEEVDVTFTLSVVSPEKPDVGYYGVKISNRIGEVMFKFQIKDPDDEEDPWFQNVLVLAAICMGAAVIVTAIIVIGVIRCKKCRRRRRHRRRRAVESDSNLQMTASTETGTLSRHPSRSSSKRPNPPPKPQFSKHPNNDRNGSTTSPPCACAGFTTLHPGYVTMTNNQAAYHDGDPISEPTKRHHKRTFGGQTNLMRSRRMSRSVPSLFSGPPNCSTTPRLKPQHIQELQNSGFQSILKARKKARDVFGSVQDSGFDPELDDDDGSSEFASVSVAEFAHPSRRRRANSFDSNPLYVLRRSLEVFSDEMASEDPFQLPAFPSESASARQSENKYMSMSMFYRGSRMPSSHRESRVEESEEPLPPPPVNFFGAVMPGEDLFPPPPVACNQSFKGRVYENLGQESLVECPRESLMENECQVFYRH